MASTGMQGEVELDQAKTWFHRVTSFVEENPGDSPEEVTNGLRCGDVQVQAKCAAYAEMFQQLIDASIETREDGTVTAFLFADRSVLLWYIDPRGECGLTVTTLQQLQAFAFTATKKEQHHA